MNKKCIPPPPTSSKSKSDDQTFKTAAFRDFIVDHYVVRDT